MGFGLLPGLDFSSKSSSKSSQEDNRIAGGDAATIIRLADDSEFTFNQTITDTQPNNGSTGGAETALGDLLRFTEEQAALAGQKIQEKTGGGSGLLLIGGALIVAFLVVRKVI